MIHLLILFVYCLILSALSWQYFEREKWLRELIEKRLGKKIGNLAGIYGPILLLLAWVAGSRFALDLWFNTTYRVRVGIAIVVTFFVFLVNLSKRAIWLRLALSFPLAGLGVFLSIRKWIKGPSPNPVKIKLRNIILLLAVLTSFCFPILLTKQNWKIMGGIVCALLAWYLALMVLDSFRIQKQLLAFTDRANFFDEFLGKIKSLEENSENSGLVLGVKLVVYLFSAGDKGDRIKGVEKLKETLEKIAFWSVYSVSALRTLLFVRLLSSFILLVTFGVVVEGEYLSQLEKLFSSHPGPVSAVKWIAMSFHVFTGGETRLPFTPQPSFAQAQLLVISILGWLSSLLFIILVLDIFSSSYAPFNEVLVKITRRLRREIATAIDILESDKPISNKQEFTDGIISLFKIFYKGRDEDFTMFVQSTKALQAARQEQSKVVQGDVANSSQSDQVKGES